MMDRVSAAMRVLVGLFVDDGAFALAILAWVAVTAVLSLSGILAAAWRGPLLFVGLAGLLATAVVRTARRA